MPSLTFPDGSVTELPEGEPLGACMPPDAVAARLDGNLRDLSWVPAGDGDVAPVTLRDPDGVHVMRHSAAHLLAQAVCELYPRTRYAIGPVVEDGFYYDFSLPSSISSDDLPRVEERMREIVAADRPFIREEVGRDEALSRLSDQPFKVEIIQMLADEEQGEVGSGDTVTIYRNGTWEDLCLGPHLPSTGRIGAFKLTHVAGAYWRGDESQPMLTRIYGVAFATQGDLDAHMIRLEEAERRDHRKLGVELDLFSFPEEIGSGLAVFHPRGGLVRRLMEEYSRTKHEAAGYLFVNTPHISKSALFETSGHLQWYADGMFPPMELDGGTDYYLKPMNCPFHILIYRSRIRSYRELPMRLFEFGTVYRYEKSGVIHGLTRVRGLTMDDSHIFCTTEQMGDEISSLLTFVLDLLRDFGLSDFYLEISTRPKEKSVGADEEWERATEALRTSAEGMDLDLVLDEGGGSFYGPKISVQARDAIGRTWQMSTIQLDFQFPQRFDLYYTGADNARHRPVMIHRALFGSVERFFAILLEHYAGALPLWLSPEQVRFVPVADRHVEQCNELAEAARSAGLRAEVDDAKESVGKKIRAAQLMKTPYTVVVGDRDIEAGTYTVRDREGKETGGLSIQQILDALSEESRTRALDQTQFGT